MSITGLTASNKVYDGNIIATITGSPTVGELISGDFFTVVTGTATFANKSVGTNKAVTFTDFTLGGVDAGNYILSQPASVTADITAKPVTITGVVAVDRVENGTTVVALTGGTLVGVESGDAVGFTLGAGTVATAAVGNSKAVTTSVVLTGADAGNYTLAQPAGVTVNIGPAVSVLTPDRLIPVPAAEEAVVASVNLLSSGFTAGPNIISGASGGVVKIYRAGAAIGRPRSVGDNVLTVYDATGNVVNKITVSDNATLSTLSQPSPDNNRRVVGAWDLRGANGYPVSEGVYLLRGVVRAVDGGRERVSLPVSVR